LEPPHARAGPVQPSHRAGGSDTRRLSSIRRRTALVALAATGLAATPPTVADAHSQAHHDKELRRPILHMIHWWRDETHRYQRYMMRPRTPYSGAAERTDSREYRIWLRNLWHRRAKKARKTWQPYRMKWLPVAECESDRRWYLDGRYDGGLQFAPSTWLDHRGGRYARYAYRATPSEQMAIGERVLHAQGWSAWPNCS
jgi:uncharacterized ferritin-like protein (DUF455 family)